MNRYFFANYYCLSTLLLLISCGTNEKTLNTHEQQPNIIYILADDLGYGDLSCYGQTHFETPNIDQLAARGIKFTQHYAGSTVCAPSRSSLLTGKHTGHTSIRGNREYQPEGQEPLPDEALTIAELLKNADYNTGAVGKWGLGFIGSEGDPNLQGFDYFFGYNCQRYAHRYYPEYLWENDKKYMLKGNDWRHTITYAPDIIQQKAIEFIESGKGQPFFLYYAATMPHAEIISPDDSVFQKFEGQYEETPHPGFNAKVPGGAEYGENLAISGYAPCEKPRATFASMIYRLDKYVGEITYLLDSLKIADNTIIIFTSDNGPHQEGGADPDFFNSNGPLKGYKRDLFEGGIRVPMIVQWPDQIKPGLETNHISAFWDVFATIADITNVNADVEDDGISFLPTLLNKPEQQKEHEYLYWEFHEKGGRQAVRKGDWKYVKYNVFKRHVIDTMLFNLSADIGETFNLADKHPKMIKEFEEILKNEHDENPIFPFISK